MDECCLGREEFLKILDVAFQRRLHHSEIMGIKMVSITRDKTLSAYQMALLDSTIANSFTSKSHPNSPNFHLVDHNLLKDGLHECEQIFYKTPKRNPSFDNYLNFTVAKRLLKLKNYKALMSIPIKERLKSIESPHRLSWIVTLLINYHYREECSIFMSTAITLCLKVLQLSLFRSEKTNFRGKFLKYIKMITKYKCHDHVLIDAVKAFYVYLKPKQIFRFYGEIMDLNFLLETLQKDKFKAPALLNTRKPGKLKNYDVCFALDQKKFVTLVKFGASSIYTEKDLLPVEDIPSNLGRSFKSMNLRINQTICLHRESKMGEKSRQRTEFVLKLLWASIPDPFLVYESQFLLTIHIPRNGTEIYLWYKNIVLNGQSPEESPRSLKHLSRCAIRLSLAKNFQLPNGLLLLNLPKSIHSYLSLEECGRNPFQE